MSELERYKSSELDSFSELIQSNSYIDKSLLLIRIIENKEKNLCFLRNSGSGKSVTINSLEKYYSVDENITFFPLRINSFLNVHKRSNRYEVINLDFSKCFSTNSLKCIYQIKLLFKSLMNNYPFLFNNKHSSDYFISIYEDDDKEIDYTSFLSHLIGEIVKHSGREVIVLIDGIDEVLIYALYHNYFNEIEEFLKTTLENMIQKNEYHRLIMTSIFKLSIQGITYNSILDRFNINSYPFNLHEHELEEYLESEFFQLQHIMDSALYQPDTFTPIYIPLFVQNRIKREESNKVEYLFLDYLLRSNIIIIPRIIEKLLSNQPIKADSDLKHLAYKDLLKITHINDCLLALTLFGLLSTYLKDSRLYFFIANNESKIILRRYLKKYD